MRKRVLAMLIRITAPHFVAGIELSPNSKVIRAAPILSYMVGWDIKRVVVYCNKKNWKAKRL